MKTSLRKPENWADFEDLCKRLWTEIWDYPETKRHGRSGQKQKGIDIYGKEKPNAGFTGIQCKGKDEYTDTKLTRKEIDEEVEKAKQFKPPLAKMYFATTANRSVEIEEYIREKSEENITAGLFSIHVYFWEDIVELIDQNKVTHDWYDEGQSFSNKYKATLKCHNGEEEVTIYPIFNKYVITYQDIKVLDLIDIPSFVKDLNVVPMPFGMKPISIKTKEDLTDFMNTLTPVDTNEQYLDPQPKQYRQDPFFREFVEIKKSVGCISLILSNVGPTAISEIKLTLQFEGVLSVYSVDKDQAYIDLLSSKYTYNVRFPEEKLGVIEHRILVPGDRLKIDEICFMTIPEDTVCSIIWTLFSKEYQTNGVIKINVNPKFEINETEQFVERPQSFKSEMISCKIEFE